MKLALVGLLLTSLIVGCIADLDRNQTLQNQQLRDHVQRVCTAGEMLAVLMSADSTDRWDTYLEGGMCYFWENTHQQAVPETNGCGSNGWAGTAAVLDYSIWCPRNVWEDVEACCDLHDCCYDMCGMHRDYCDLLLQSCTRSVCGNGINFYKYVKDFAFSNWANAQAAKCSLESIPQDMIADGS